MHTNWVLSGKSRFIKMLLIVGLLLPLLNAFLGTSQRTAYAENFVNSPFQEQWNRTDADVANGKIARTFFWGPQAFAHTQEVYSDAPTGTREVQYFDKGRMELTNKDGQAPSSVTNGLLTVELVTGKMQVGDSSFINHNPADNPVAGDPSNNDACPTYASFNKGKLAFGVAGAIDATNRTNQKVDQRIDKDGNLYNISTMPATVKYAAFISETKHNIADVFYNFFLSSPLGWDKWLPVMGFPISEPYWITTTLAGHNRTVLVQLFERRALTFTPTNPNGFQVEMANIGQHYYAWRYQVDTQNDVLPGNYRLLWTQGNSLYSSSIHKAENFKVADSKNPIQSFFPNHQGIAAAIISNSVSLVNLSVSGQFQPLPLDENVKNAFNFYIFDVKWSSDGKRVAVGYITYKNVGIPDKYVYDRAIIQIYDLNGTKVTSSFKAFDKALTTEPNYGSLKLSHDGHYLAFYGNYNASSNLVYTVEVVNLDNKTDQVVSLDQQPEDIEVNNLEWIGNSSKLLITYNHIIKNFGRIATLDPVTKSVNILSDVPLFSQTSLSPDGNYLALLYGDRTNEIKVNFRALANPTSELSTSGVISLDKDYPGKIGDFFTSTLMDWGVDGSYIGISNTRRNAEYRLYSSYISLMPQTGKTILSEEYGYPGMYNGIFYRTEYTFGGGPHYVAHNSLLQPYNYIFSQDITVKNTDGSDPVTLYSTKDGSKFVNPLEIVQVLPVKN